MRDRPLLLLIDDEQSLVENLTVLLKREGFDVITELTGAGGLQRFRDEAPDIVLSDVRMPKVTGIDVLEEIRRSSPETPVVLMTAQASLQSAIQSDAASMTKCGAAVETRASFHGELVQHTVRYDALHSSTARRNICPTRALLNQGYTVHLRPETETSWLVTPLGARIDLDNENGLHFLPLAPLVDNEVCYADLTDLAKHQLFADLGDGHTPTERATVEVVHGLTANERKVQLAHQRTHANHQSLYLLRDQLSTSTGVVVPATWGPHLPKCMSCMRCKMTALPSRTPRI